MEKKFIIVDPIGLHARPATLLVNEASKFVADSTIVSNDKQANLKSIMGVMSLGIVNGAEFIIDCSGTDEEAALDAITNIISINNIGEEK